MLYPREKIHKKKFKFKNCLGIHLAISKSKPNKPNHAFSIKQSNCWVIV